MEGRFFPKTNRMRPAFLLCFLLSLPFMVSWSQTREPFVSRSYEEFYEWFHRHSQVDQLYDHRSTLYIFGERARVYSAPHRGARPVTELRMGQAVENIAYTQDDLPLDEINGYGDLWFHITGRDLHGHPFTGYVWGADIARGWRRADITGDRRPEFVLLGLSSRPRQSVRDINAEIRVLQNGRLLAQQTIPGLCLFEDCGASPMLRILNDPEQTGMPVIEASTMTIGCEVGIEKAFLFWDGRRLERVFHAEYTTQHNIADKEFSLKVRDEQSGRIIGLKVCRYSHEDENYNPVWDCRIIELKETESTPRKEKEKARAR